MESVRLATPPVAVTDPGSGVHAEPVSESLYSKVQRKPVAPPNETMARPPLLWMAVITGGGKIITGGPPDCGRGVLGAETTVSFAAELVTEPAELLTVT